MALNIENFYDKTDAREHLRQPFKLDGKTCATTGYAMIIMPEYGDYPACADWFTTTASKALALINDVNNHEQFQPIPDGLKLPEKIQCNTCQGSGKVTQKQCEECLGAGEVDFDNGYNSYTCDCKSCDGDGDIFIDGGDDECHECHGGGSTYPRHCCVELLGIGVSANLLELIINEPGIEVCAANSMSDAAMALYFRTGDSTGLIMELRE